MLIKNQFLEENCVEFTLTTKGMIASIVQRSEPKKLLMITKINSQHCAYSIYKNDTMLRWVFLLRSRPRSLVFV